MASLASVMPVTLQNQPDGTIDLDEVEHFCRPADPHLAVTKLFCLESTHNECNGRVLRMPYIKKAKKVARRHKMKMHLDGARCLNAAVYLGISPAEMCQDFDTVSICLSKGLGCPAGSLLVGSEKDIKYCLILRKLLGGNLRQAGILCKAGLENLKDWDKKLKVDHIMAQEIANELEQIDCIDIDKSLIETNILRFKFKPDFKKFKHNEFAELMRDEHGILMNYGHKNEALRIVTHRDIS